MRRDIPSNEEYSLDSEIERTLRRRRRESRDMSRIKIDPDRPIREHVVPNLDDLNPVIVRPTIQAQHFELKPVMQEGILEDVLQLKLFPYSLRDLARAWLNALSSGMVASWNDVFQRFLLRCNLPNMNSKLRNDITSFRQSEDETLYEAWETLKELLRKCLMHGFQHWT
ncbi:protein FAR1-RELATED SEQUENCE 5-like [Gossypium australe]|uniref:Protein FAR1-RELATED SEQUENCE 5-like n=1 Tax=Gossypium australe TaxID=47621 RepID=A0A5B6WZV2_9ROSI|nr:protein FAR1-RELATED SEQUENCE 5-like [Gossypium australe]